MSTGIWRAVVWVQREMLPLTGIEPRFLGSPASSLVTISNELSPLFVMEYTIRSIVEIRHNNEGLEVSISHWNNRRQKQTSFFTLLTHSNTDRVISEVHTTRTNNK